MTFTRRGAPVINASLVKARAIGDGTPVAHLRPLSGGISATVSTPKFPQDVTLAHTLRADAEIAFY
jgi:hypothetical protein